MDHAFSDRLLLLPLFQGFSRLDFLDIVGKTAFDFQTLAPGHLLVRQGDECEGLCIVMNGDVTLETCSPDQTYRFEEELKAPYVVQLECVFGLHNRYRHSVRALTETRAVKLDKQSLRKLLLVNTTFQINFYNALCTQAQHTGLQVWQSLPEDLVERFAQFVMARSTRPVGAKKVYVRMEDFAQQLGVTRIRVSRMLAQLATEGLVSYSRASTTVPAIEKLTAYCINRHTRAAGDE